ncbi:glycosyltransferase [Marichromatium gracile]|uniref:Glycosyl transferase group 1 n=1 Tax=Marichromatium gracile TaxID=1048 RepID=A0ABR5VK62_MARGR|nr:glycosyltransferase [Marichromatium gracile]KXX65977.1 glycosyl transferase group 1 [Marichromatium gracile]
MTTIVHVVQHLRPGGLQTVVLELARHGAATERHLVMSLEGEGVAAVAAWPRLQTHVDRLRFLAKPPGWTPGLVPRLARLLRAEGAVAVHTHCIGPLVYGGLAARLAGVRHLVHTEHDARHLESWSGRWLQWTALALTRPRLVADAEHVAARIRARLPGWRPRVILNGVDTDEFVPGDRAVARGQLDLPREVRLIGCAARLHPVKGQRLLIEALLGLDADTHLALAGSGPEEGALRRLVARLGLAKRVHFMGWVDAMPTFYQALDLFCLPALAEGLPLAPLEAQSCGIPVVVTAAGGVAETACPDSARVVPPGDVAALSTALAVQLVGIERALPSDPRPYVLACAEVRAMAAAYAALRQPAAG